MAYLLLAIDFPTNGGSPVDYGCRLAGFLKADVVLINAFISPPPDLTGGDMWPVMPAIDLAGIAEERLQGLLTEVRPQFPDLNIGGKTMYGDITGAIREYIENAGQPPLLTIVTNDAAGDGAALSWLDNNALDALRELPCPVMAVLPGTTFHTVRNICFACHDMANLDTSVTSRLRSLATAVGASVHVLCVAARGENAAVAEAKLQDELQGVDVSFHFMENEKIDDTIKLFVNAGDVDWLVLSPHKHSFWQRIFHKSHTAAMIHSSQIPVVALHTPE